MTESDAHDINAVGSPGDENLRMAYEVLLRQYRESLNRVHVLETEVRNLTNAFMQSASQMSGPVGPANTPSLDIYAIIERLQALEDRSVQQQHLIQPETDAMNGEGPTPTLNGTNSPNSASKTTR